MHKWEWYDLIPNCVFKSLRQLELKASNLLIVNGDEENYSVPNEKK